jgi:hypothetical protein
LDSRKQRLLNCVLSLFEKGLIESFGRLVRGGPFFRYNFVPEVPHLSDFLALFRVITEAVVAVLAQGSRVLKGVWASLCRRDDVVSINSNLIAATATEGGGTPDPLAGCLREGHATML